MKYVWSAHLLLPFLSWDQQQRTNRYNFVSKLKVEKNEEKIYVSCFEHVNKTTENIKAINRQKLELPSCKTIFVDLPAHNKR